MPGWGKLVAGTVLGAVGALYATNEEFRRQLPEKARDLPVTVRRRFEMAAAAAREASARRRAEILHELEERGDPAERGTVQTPRGTLPETVAGAPATRRAGEPATRAEHTEDI